MALSMREIARKCLNRFGAISVQSDILALRQLPPPRSLQDELNFIQTNRCPPKGPTNLRVTGVADRTIHLAWSDQSDNEDGFKIRFRGKKAGLADHTGSKTVGRNVASATLDSLRSNHEYTISVLAFNSGGESPSSNTVQATTPARTITVSSEGGGLSTVFTVKGTGFTPNGLVVIVLTDQNFKQLEFPETAGADGKFVSRHSVPCGSGIRITFTAFEDADPVGTFANAIETTCP
jgi:hypothetical protein